LLLSLPFRNLDLAGALVVPARSIRSLGYCRHPFQRLDKLFPDQMVRPRVLASDEFAIDNRVGLEIHGTRNDVAPAIFSASITWKYISAWLSRVQAAAWARPK
jgi:hypothetical protein